MTQKDLAIDRRQIPAQRSAQRLGDRKGSGETNMGVTPHLVLWLQSNPLFCFIYLFIYITRTWHNAPAQVLCLHRHRVIVAISVWSHWPARQDYQLMRDVRPSVIK